MSKSVFGIAADPFQALRITTSLKAAGFRSDDISILLPDKEGSRDFAHEHGTKAPEGAAAGASAGGLLGGALGWLAGLGSLAIPGLGPFIAAGPLMAALSGAAIGAGVGGLTGALIGFGIPEFEARRYESKLQGGNVLVSVHSDDGDHVRRAREILESEGATDIAVAEEAPVKAARQRSASS